MNIRTIVATEHDGMEVRSLVINIRILDEDQVKTFDVESAVRKAVHEYLCTKEGKAIYDYNCEGFNWADFEANVPNEICRKYGFEKIDASACDLDVDLDEHLADDEAIRKFWTQDRVLEIARTHIRNANPSSWDGTGPKPESFDEGEHTYPIDKYTELHIQFFEDTPKTKGWCHLCELRDNESKDLIDTLYGNGINSEEALSETILKICRDYF